MNDRQLVVYERKKIPFVRSVLFPKVACLLALLLLTGALSALGTTETAALVLNPEWTFAITAFDVSAVPAAQQSVGEIVQRNLFRIMSVVDKRTRPAEEYMYYENVAWEKARTDSAKRVSDKQNQRDQLAYQGDPSWKYRKSLKTIEADMAKLKDAFQEVDAQAPSIEKTPVFKFINDNKDGAYPAPPAAGGEYRFCASQKIDGFMTGSLAPYHGRLFLTIKIWALFSNSFIYEDSSLFSPEDAAVAVSELTENLIACLSGASHSRLVVRADPPDASVFVNETLIANGEAVDRSNGTVTVVASADKHETISVPVDLNPDEEAEVSISLPPVSYKPFVIETDNEGDSIYQGALFVGHSPVSLDLPLNRFEYFKAESEGKAGAIVMGEENSILNIKKRVLPREGEKPVEKAQDKMYAAYGRFWIALPVALVAGLPWQGGGGMYGAAYNAFVSSQTQKSADNANTWFIVSIVGVAAVAVTLADTIFRAVRYFSISSKNSPKLVK
jgi:hypothetical protein